MKALPLITVVAVLCCSTPQALCGEKIEGAFGVRLGDIIDTTKAVKTTSERVEFYINERTIQVRDIQVYHIAVTNPPKVFYTFFFEITPNSHKVYRITAKGSELSKEEQEELQKVLREKYNTKKGEAGLIFKVIDQGNRYIEINQVVIHSGYINIPGTTITTLRYTDEELLQLALKEVAQTIFKDKSKY